MDLAYADLDAMLDATKPEAVCAFGSIYDHLQVVAACAPRQIHVMVEPTPERQAAYTRLLKLETGVTALTREHGRTQCTTEIFSQ